MPKGLMLGILTLVISATLITFLNSGIGVPNAGSSHGAFYLGTSGEPLLDGFRVTYRPGIGRISWRSAPWSA